MTEALLSPSWQAVVIGCSAGGFQVLKTILPKLPADFPLPIVVISHTSADGGDLLADLLERFCALPVKVAEDKMLIGAPTIYVAPAGYHLLIDHDRSFALNVDAKVCNVRPAIDVLFHSAAEAFAGRLIGVLLTGANQDGCAGLAKIKAEGGLTIAQDPETATARVMPESAITAGVVDHIAAPEDIADLLLRNLI